MKTLLATLLLLATQPCLAQQGTTGDLTGIVTSGGQPLPGVTITLTSAALQGTRTTITGDNGGYRFTLLPPADYIAHFESSGFAPAESSVHVALAEVARTDVALIASPMREEIVVTPKGAPNDTAIETNVDAAVLQQLPGARDIRAATLLSPAVDSLGLQNRLVIAGAPSWDSLYLIDGVAASEYLTGQPQNVVLEDAIQEVAVLSGAISAEYGRFTGGVVSTITKSGGNGFSGSLRDTMTNAAWTLRTPSREARGADHLNHAAEATLGGFAIRDRLWFFGGFRNADRAQNLATSVTNIPYVAGSRDRRWEGKLTNQIAANHSLVLSFADVSLEEKNALDSRNGANVLDLPSLIADRTQPARLLSLSYNGILAPGAIAEVQYSQKRSALRGNGGLTADRIRGTTIATNSGNLNAPFGCGICGDDERDNKSLVAKASFYRNTRWGNHNAVAGGEGFRETRTNAGTRSASGFSIQNLAVRKVDGNVYPIFGSQTVISLTEHYEGDRGSDLQTASAYLNDRWDVTSRATINIGFRYDRNNARDAAGRLISNDAAWSPRLSATVEIPQRQQLLASFGRYSAKILEGGGSPQQIGTFNQKAWLYNGPAINASGPPDQLLPPAAALAQVFAWLDSRGGAGDTLDLRFITTPNTTSVFHGSLQSPSVDERTLGYAFHWTHGFLRADAIARDWHHFYAARVDHTTGQGTIGGIPYDVQWVINDNSETVRRYRAVQLQASWEAGNLRAGSGYTWSKLQGNDDEEDSGAGPRNLPLALWYPELVGYPQRRPFGYLRQDERNRLRLWAEYQFRSLSGMIVQRLDSGRPYSAIISLNAGNILPKDGYSLTQLTQTPYYIGGRRGAYRTDDVYSTDLALQYDLPVRGARLFVKADVLNLLNHSAVLAPNTTVKDARSGLSLFNPFTETPVAGVHYQIDPTIFGQPSGPDSYQTPRTFQIALGARF